MHRNMTTTTYGILDKNTFRLYYMYHSLLIEERTETLIYDIVGITNNLSFMHTLQKIKNIHVIKK